MVSSKFVAGLAGDCSFCAGSHTDARALVGVPDSASRICNRCVEDCIDHLYLMTDGGSPGLRAQAEQRLDERLERRWAELASRSKEAEKIVREMQELAEQPVRPQRAFTSMSCSFCGKEEHDSRKIVSGLRAFICETCVYEAADVIATIG